VVEIVFHVLTDKITGVRNKIPIKKHNQNVSDPDELPCHTMGGSSRQLSIIIQTIPLSDAYGREEFMQPLLLYG
jgi:hypothetical protein